MIFIYAIDSSRATPRGEDWKDAEIPDSNTEGGWKGVDRRVRLGNRNIIKRFLNFEFRKWRVSRF